MDSKSGKPLISRDCEVLVGCPRSWLTWMDFDEIFSLDGFLEISVWDLSSSKSELIQISGCLHFH